MFNPIKWLRLHQGYIRWLIRRRQYKRAMGEFRLFLTANAINTSQITGAEVMKMLEEGMVELREAIIGVDTTVVEATKALTSCVKLFQENPPK